MVRIRNIREKEEIERDRDRSSEKERVRERGIKIVRKDKVRYIETDKKGIKTSKRESER